MLKFVLALIAAAAIAVTLGAGSAKAHYTTWYWSQASAEEAMEYSRWARIYDVQIVSCRGTGNWIWSKEHPRLRLFKHFDCKATQGDGSQFYAKLHVVGHDAWRVSY